MNYTNYNYYPFWFGYPPWYPSAYWYWYPYWFHWGYYYGTDRSIIVVGLPSYYFVQWYFSIPYHHYKYPYFSDYLITHYKRSPGPSRTGLHVAMRDWERRSRSTVTDQLLNNDSRRVERLKEYGRFEENYERRSRTKSDEVINRDEYLEQNKRRYPNLTGTEKNTIRYSQPTTERTIRERTVPSRTYQLNRAKDDHQRTWQRSNYTLRKTPTTRTRSSSATQQRRKKDN